MSLFRWRKGEHENWIKKINRFNRKIDKAAKEGYTGELPKKISYKESLLTVLKQGFTRREFNNQLKTIDIFLEKDSLDTIKNNHGAVAPKWQLDTIKKVILPDINKGNKEFKEQNKKIIKDLDADEWNDNNTRERKLNFERKSKKDFEMFVETFSDFNKPIEERNRSTREGYIKAIENEIGKDDNTINGLALKGIIDNLPDDIVTANALYNERTMFNFVYSKDEFDRRFKTIHNEWIRIAKEYNAEQEKAEKKAKKSKKK